MATPLTVGSLFSGIGGLDLGLERAGMRVIWQSEIDPYACRVLNKHWPEVTNHGDIKTIDWGTVQRPDVICGGYPCQPFSTAGKRQGRDDPRHLWPWVLDAISGLRPRYAILENVRGHLSMGGLSVIGELATIGYDAEWRVISAASVGANHRRDRIVIVAYPQSQFGNVGESRRDTNAFNERGDIQGETGTGRSAVANTDHSRYAGRNEKTEPEPNGLGFNEARERTATPNDGRVPEQSENVAYPQGGYGRVQEPYGLREVFRQASELGELSRHLGTLGYWWETEPDVGRVANGVPDRVDRLKGLGNAVVPQVAELVGRLVVEHSTH